MGQFEEIFNKSIIEEESRVVKTRTFYPRKVKQAGGFSSSFIKCLDEELVRLKAIDETITVSHILKSLDFEVKRQKKL